MADVYAVEVVVVKVDMVWVGDVDVVVGGDVVDVVDVVVVCLSVCVVVGSVVLPDSMHPETRTSNRSKETKRMLPIYTLE